MVSWRNFHGWSEWVLRQIKEKELVFGILNKEREGCGVHTQWHTETGQIQIQFSR